MGDLVEEDGDEEADDPDDADDGAEVDDEGGAEQRRDDQRGPVDPDGRTDSSADGKRQSQHRDLRQVYGVRQTCR